MKIRHLVFVILAACSLMSAQDSSNGPKHGLWCHGPQDADTGLWCSTINTHFVPQQGTGYTTSIQFLQNRIIQITGTMTFAPEGQALYGTADDYDANGNPICYEKDSSGNVVYDSNGYPIVVACQMQYDYGMTQWDITAGTSHFVNNPANPFLQPDSLGRYTNSGCGDGLQAPQMTDGSYAFYICGDNVDTASTGILVLIIPKQYLMGRKSYTNLEAQATDAQGNVWNTGLYIVVPDATGELVTYGPNGSAVAALDPAPAPKGKRNPNQPKINFPGSE